MVLVAPFTISIRFPLPSEGKDAVSSVLLLGSGFLRMRDEHGVN